MKCIIPTLAVAVVLAASSTTDAEVTTTSGTLRNKPPGLPEDWWTHKPDSPHKWTPRPRHQQWTPNPNWTPRPDGHWTPRPESHWTPSPHGHDGTPSPQGGDMCPPAHGTIPNRGESRLHCRVGNPGNFSSYELATEMSGQTRTMHGLWPNYPNNDGGYPWPQYCSTEAFNITSFDSVSGLKSAMDTYWPSNNNQGSFAEKTNSQFWGHEWTRHGTCSGMTQPEFFCTAINFFLVVKGNMTATRQPYSKEQVQSVPNNRVVTP